MRARVRGRACARGVGSSMTASTSPVQRRMSRPQGILIDFPTQRPSWSSSTMSSKYATVVLERLVTEPTDANLRDLARVSSGHVSLFPVALRQRLALSPLYNNRSLQLKIHTSSLQPLSETTHCGDHVATYVLRSCSYTA